MAMLAHLPANIVNLPLVNFPTAIRRGPVPMWGGHLGSFSLTKALQARAPEKSHQDIIRPLANFPPTIWGDRFASFSFKNSEFESYARQIEVLKQKVKDMLMASQSDAVEKINLINSLCRLGVSYHFESEMEEQLNLIFHAQSNLFNDNHYDLYTVALLFRVFRQHGYRVSCDVFNKFKDNDGKFKDTLTSDIRGLLSLYEATHLSIRGEDILDEALTFTSAHLKSLADQSSPHLAKHVLKALYRPFHKGIGRVETRLYISFYEEDESRNEMLLKFAKLDFNALQLLHLQELSQLSCWWKDINIALKLPYARDRVVEMYFWSIGVYCEPYYARGRIILTKFLMLLSIIDDTYDAYGNLEELQRFTDAVQRWDIAAIHQLPDYMKIIYKALLNFYDELEEELTSEGRSYNSVSYAKDELKKLVGAYNVEAQWLCKSYVPPFDEYMSTALVTSGIYAIVATSFVGMGQNAGIKAFEWLLSAPKIFRPLKTMARLSDDIVTHKAEEERGHVASSISCYMKQYGVSKKEAIEEFQRRIANAWKIVNEECLRPFPVSVHLLLRAANIRHLVDVTYKYGDWYTNSEHLKDYITALFIDKISM